MADNLKKRFKDYINREELIDFGLCKNIVAGISGGMDSVCLLLLLKETFEDAGIKITAVHINHNLRPEAKSDEDFVRELCKKLDVELRVFSEDVKGLAGQEEIGLEEAGRQLRYLRFIQVAKELNGKGKRSTKIAVAHHMNDNAETVIFNMLRGSNLAGLSGILPRQTREGVEIIRPLLFAGKEEIEAFLTERGQDYVTDSTNKDTNYSRNKIRQDIIPQMKEINSRAVEHIAEAAETARETEKFLKEKTDEAYDHLVKIYDSEYFIDAEALKAIGQFLAKRIVYRAIGEIKGSFKDITGIHVDSVINLGFCESGKRVNISGDIEAVKEGKNIVIKRQKPEHEKADIIISKSELEKGFKWNLSENETVVFSVVDVTDQNRKEIIKKNQYTKAFDYDRISDSVFLGSGKGNERIRLQQGEKKLNRFFIDQRIPRDRRKDFSILSEGEEVIWILGLRISEKYKITDATKKALIVSIPGGSYGQD